MAEDGCPIIVDNSYCVEENYGSPPVTTPGGTTTPTTTARPTTTAGNGVVTPQPTQSGMAPNCNKFVFVRDGDGFCGDIAKRAGITTSDFYKWNAGVGDGCQNLWLDTNYCVGLIGMTTTSGQPPATTTTGGPTSTTTTPGNGVVTPQPTQPGMVSNCAKFVFVREGDGYCGDISKGAGISTTDFYAWNTGVGTGCQNLWLDTYYCVGLIGMTTTTSLPAMTTATTTTAGNGVVTPSPTQAGIAPNCNKFVLVQEGDGFCDDIAKKAGISSADFYKWNSGVGTDCKNLWLDTYYCVGLVGPTPTTPPPTTTTTSGNGVTTPTPIQDGMVSSCRKFHFGEFYPGPFHYRRIRPRKGQVANSNLFPPPLVVSLDTCATLAKQYSITEADFYKWNPAVNSGGTCKSLWLETYVCVGL